MANPEFVKCGCRHCGGHIEFPTVAAGQTVACPHCGQPTVLGGPGILPVPLETPSNKRVPSARLWLAGGAVLSLLAAGAAAAFFWSRKAEPHAYVAKTSPPVAWSNPPVVPPPTPLVAQPPQPREVTNDFAIMPFKLEQIPGSSLVYVVGLVRNISDRQRFGVKVEFGLFDTNDNPVGSATDYQSVLEPRAEWRFQAMVIPSKTVSARFRSIAEDQ